MRRKAKAEKVKPRFIRQDSWRYKKLETGWRKPKGIDSKMRLHRKGYHPTPGTGYRSPKTVKGLHPSGYREISVGRPEDLEGLNPEIQAIRISGSVGRRKREQILSKASEMRIKVLNPLKKTELKLEEE